MAIQKQVKIVESQCYAIEKILQSQLNGEKLEYLIKWKNCPESENSWQSIDDLFSKKKSTPEETHNATRVVVTNARPPGTQEPLTPLENANASAEQSKMKSRRGIRLNSNIPFENVSVTPKTSKIPLRTNEEEQEEENADEDVECVKKIRKRQSRIEYLLKWKNSDDDNDEEWIDRDTAVTKYPQHVIAYYQSIVRFK